MVHLRHYCRILPAVNRTWNHIRRTIDVFIRRDRGHSSECLELTAQFSEKYVKSCLLVFLFFSLYLWLLITDGATNKPPRYIPIFVQEKNSFVKEVEESKLLYQTRDNKPIRKIPKVVHFTWGGYRPMRFHQMVSFLSAYHVIKPERITVWYAIGPPRGKWWEFVKQNLADVFDDVIQVIHRPDKFLIHGKMLGPPEHRSDIARMDILIQHGGIYMDLDVIALKPFDSLLVHRMVIGRESDEGLCNGIMLAEPGALFLRVWYGEYKSYNSKYWQKHSVVLPSYLAELYPWLVHVENTTMDRPSWFELERLYGKELYNWSENYAIHLWFRLYNKDHDLESIKKENSTFGQICRFILFGDRKAKRT